MPQQQALSSPGSTCSTVCGHVSTRPETALPSISSRVDSEAVGQPCKSMPHPWPRSVWAKGADGAEHTLQRHLQKRNPTPTKLDCLGTVHRVVSPGGKAGKGSLTSEDRGEGRLRTGTRKKRGDWEEARHFTDLPIWLIYFATKKHGL